MYLYLKYMILIQSVQNQKLKETFVFARPIHCSQKQ